MVATLKKFKKIILVGRDLLTVPKKERRRRKTVATWKAINGDGTLRLDYPLKSSSIVFDVGGYEGKWSQDIYNKYGSKIYIFEPVKKYNEKISQLFENNPQIETLPFGLSGRNEELNITLQGDRSSFFQPGQDAESVRIVRISDFILERGLTVIDLIKINIEGSEYDLLEDLIQTGLINRIKDIQVQFHNFATEAEMRRSKLQQELAKTHSLTYNYDFVWENWRLNQGSETDK